MKTPINIVRFTLLGLGLTLAGCGEDPLLLAEIIAANANDEAAPREPQEPEVDEPEPPSPVDVYPEDSDEARFVDLMLQYCGACHTEPSQPSGGLDYIGDLDQLIDKGMIVPGRKDNSRIYQRMADGTMPPVSTRYNRPSPEEIELVGEFIDSL